MENENVIWDADDYNNTNYCQSRDSKDLMELIKENGADRISDAVIVDVGCGSGNITKMLSRRLQCKKIYAFDLDAQMVEFANESNKSEKIEYFVQNISLPWEHLDDKLKNLEGMVDIVWSNYVLHWVPNKATAVKTIIRLLKPGGRLYCNVGILRDLHEFADDEEMKEHGKYFNIVTQEEQAKNFESYFRAGLSQVKIEFGLKSWTCESLEQKKTSVPAEALLQRMTNDNFEKLSKEDKANSLKIIGAKLFSSFETQYGKDARHNNDKANLAFYYECLKVAGEK